MRLNDDETRELLELLEESKLSDWERRQRRLQMATVRLGMWESGRFIGKGLAEIVNRARTGKLLKYDEFIVVNLGMLPRERVSTRPRKSEESVR
jgi:hypothetical protein